MGFRSMIWSDVEKMLRSLTFRFIGYGNIAIFVLEDGVDVRIVAQILTDV